MQVKDNFWAKVPSLYVKYAPLIYGLLCDKMERLIIKNTLTDSCGIKRM